MSKTTLKKQGTVQSFNYSPKGSFEGLLLETDHHKAIQINFPQHLAGRIAVVAAPGTQVQAEVHLEEEGRGHAAHPVYQLVRLKTDNNQYTLSADETEEEEHHSFSGKVERLNYALHGEVNGAILDNGDFVHLKPHGAAELELTEGMELEGFGSTKSTIDGHLVIEAEEVNGIHLEKKPKPKKKAPHK